MICFDFYPRSPCGERPLFTSCKIDGLYFYPRSPCGERLIPYYNYIITYINFYPRSPCGERQANAVDQILPGHISIHALLAESDNILQNSKIGLDIFLSTLSLRRATSARLETRRRDAISIHALLAESDLSHAFGYTFASYFYPRSPCGERLIIHVMRNRWFIFLSTLSLRRATVRALKLADTMLFLSTLSLRRATQRAIDGHGDHVISIHALLAESDGRHRGNDRRPVDFYPRSPCGERPKHSANPKD